MSKAIAAIGAIAILLAAGAAAATPISPGQTITDATVLGTASVYQVFGHIGDPGGDTGPSTDAYLATFAAAAGNVFTFDATGAVSCCSDAPNIPPDGAGGGMNVGGANGLSSLSGNQHIPLVGVFTTDVDPFGSAPPAALSFDVNAPLSLSPFLRQVFYIGDGHAGYNNPAGATLTFTAPSDATRLYLGPIDAFFFANQTGYYADNKGAFIVDITLTNNTARGVPEPAAWALMILGFAGAGLALRSRRRGLIPI
jgi:hypothetical protein